jgi:hypothetical protein
MAATSADIARLPPTGVYVWIHGMRITCFQFQIKAASSLARSRLLNVLRVRLRRLDPRRLDVIFDLKPECLIEFPVQIKSLPYQILV